MQHCKHATLPHLNRTATPSAQIVLTAFRGHTSSRALTWTEGGTGFALGGVSGAGLAAVQGHRVGAGARAPPEALPTTAVAVAPLPPRRPRSTHCKDIKTKIQFSHSTTKQLFLRDDPRKSQGPTALVQTKRLNISF